MLSGLIKGHDRKRGYLTSLYGDVADSPPCGLTAVSGDDSRRGKGMGDRTVWHGPGCLPYGCGPMGLLAAYTEGAELASGLSKPLC